jgi:hypothetical protein
MAPHPSDARERVPAMIVDGPERIAPDGKRLVLEGPAGGSAAVQAG